MIADLTRKPFVTAPKKFAAQGALDAMVATMASLRCLAVALVKIANDMRWLASGLRCGLGGLGPCLSRAPVGARSADGDQRDLLQRATGG
jgi:fumarate hydratase class II